MVEKITFIWSRNKYFYDSRETFKSQISPFTLIENKLGLIGKGLRDWSPQIHTHIKLKKRESLLFVKKKNNNAAVGQIAWLKRFRSAARVKLKLHCFQMCPIWQKPDPHVITSLPRSTVVVLLSVWGYFSDSKCKTCRWAVQLKKKWFQNKTGYTSKWSSHGWFQLLWTNLKITVQRLFIDLKLCEQICKRTEFSSNSFTFLFYDKC